MRFYADDVEVELALFERRRVNDDAVGSVPEVHVGRVLLPNFGGLERESGVGDRVLFLHGVASYSLVKRDEM